MLSQELRPTSFDEMAGQEENKKILKAIINNAHKNGSDAMWLTPNGATIALIMICKI